MHNPQVKNWGNQTCHAVVFGFLFTCFFIPISFCARSQTTGLSMIRRINNAVFPKKDTVLIQAIRGHVFERETREPLTGATVVAEGHSSHVGAIVDGDGNFVLDKIHVGRNTLKISYLGFKPVVLSIMVDASRESVVDVPMEPSPLYLSELKIHSLDDIAPVGASLINTDDLKARG